MKNNRIGAVIVAGGLSSRMKDFKPLMRIGNKTMIETTINNFQLLGIENIVIVTGFRSIDIENKLSGYNVKIVKNKKFETTHMFDSVCIGLKQLEPMVEMTFVTPSDSPFVQQFTLKKMIEELKNFNLKIVQPSYEGKDGHPILMNREAIENLLMHDGTRGMQGAIENINERKNVGFVDPGIILDADNISDYLRLLEFDENRNCPSIELCEKLQNYFSLPDNVKKHCNKVAHAALNICIKLSDEGIELNKNIVVAASMLHDIAKGVPNHEKVGAGWLRDMGYGEIAEIVEEHMELSIDAGELTEKEVVYLADKLVKEDNIVSINERFSYKENFFDFDEPVMKIVKKRKEQALKIYDMMLKDTANHEIKSII